MLPDSAASHVNQKIHLVKANHVLVFVPLRTISIIVSTETAKESLTPYFGLPRVER